MWDGADILGDPSELPVRYVAACHHGGLSSMTQEVSSHPPLLDHYLQVNSFLTANVRMQPLTCTATVRPLSDLVCSVTTETALKARLAETRPSAKAKHHVLLPFG